MIKRIVPVLVLVVGVVHPALLVADDRSLRTVEYELPYSSWMQYQAGTGAMYAELAPHLDATTKSRRAAAAYLEIGKVVERHLGYHFLAFRAYSRALQLSASARPRERPRLMAEIEERIDALAERKFESLQLLTHPRVQVVDPYPRLIPETHYNEDYLRSEVRRYRSLGMHREAAATEEVLRRDIVLALLHDFEGGDAYLCIPKKSERPCDSWPYSFFQALVLVPPGLAIDARLGAPYRQEVIRPITSWEFKPNPYFRAEFYDFNSRMALVANFLKDFPEFTDRAQPLIGKMLFAHAVEVDSLTLFEEYVATFPDGEDFDSAREHIVRKNFEAAMAERRVAAMELFLQRFPESDYQLQAELAIEEFRFSEAKNSESIERLQEHLAAYPDGAFSGEVHREIDRIRFVAVRAENTISAYQDFIKEYPDSQFLEESRAGIEAIRAGEDFNLARSSNSRRAFEEFLAQYPQSSYAPEARAMIAFFEVLETRGLSDCIGFFELAHQVQVRRVIRQEYAQVLGVIVELAQGELDVVPGEPPLGAAASVVLHREVWGQGFEFTQLSNELREKYNEGQLLDRIFDLAEDPNEELYALQRLSERRLREIFPASTPGATAWREETTYSWAFGNDIYSVSPTVQMVFASRARRGRYLLEIEVDLQVDYWRHLVGILYMASSKEEKRWSQTYSATASVEVRPRNDGVLIGPLSSIVTFQFPRFETRRGEGTVILLEKRTEGEVRDFTQESYRIVGVQQIQ